MNTEDRDRNWHVTVTPRAQAAWTYSSEPEFYCQLLRSNLLFTISIIPSSDLQSQLQQLKEQNAKLKVDLCNEQK